MRKLLVVRREDDCVTERATIAHPGHHRSTRFDGRTEIDEVQPPHAVCRRTVKMREGAVIANAIGGEKEGRFTEPAQFAEFGLEQTRRAKHERRLSRAGRTNDRDALSGFDLEINPA